MGSARRSTPRWLLPALVIAGCHAKQALPVPTTQTAATNAPAPPAAAPGSALAALSSFETIRDRAARSRALFTEASRVMLSPRCANCHPDGDSPLQTDRMTLHDPPVARGDHNRGVPALLCTSCHQDSNLPLARVPGAPSWSLAPRSMAWVGKTPTAICEQVKDPKRNGGKTLPQIAAHAAQDPLVAWGWSPGHERTPAPGTQAEFGALIAAWIATGAECP